MDDIGRYYFKNSLKYYPGKYLNIILPHMSIIQPHVAYLCPLCISNVFMITSTGQKTTTEFDEDHYPPKSVGGKKTMVACKICNGGAGYKYDFTLKEHLMLLSFGKKIPNSIISSESIIKDIGKFKGGSLKIDENGDTRLWMKKNETDKILPLDG